MNIIKCSMCDVSVETEHTFDTTIVPLCRECLHDKALLCRTGHAWDTTAPGRNPEGLLLGTLCYECHKKGETPREFSMKEIKDAYVPFYVYYESQC